LIGEVGLDDPSILKEGVMFVVEEGTEGATSFTLYVEAILVNNLNRLLEAESVRGSLQLKQSFENQFYNFATKTLKHQRFSLMNS
jgi:hypothetical protein